MKEIRKQSLSVNLSDDEENYIYDVAKYLHLTIGIPNTKTAAIRHLIEEAHQKMCEDIVQANEG